MSLGLVAPPRDRRRRGLEIGVYVLVAPEPDRQQPHADDDVYIVLAGRRRGVLDVEGKAVPLERGQAVFVPAGARHGFTAFEQMSVLVIFARRWRLDQPGRKTFGPV